VLVPPSTRAFDRSIKTVWSSFSLSSDPTATKWHLPERKVTSGVDLYLFLTSGRLFRGSYHVSLLPKNIDFLLLVEPFLSMTGEQSMRFCRVVQIRPQFQYNFSKMVKAGTPLVIFPFYCKPEFPLTPTVPSIHLLVSPGITVSCLGMAVGQVL